MQFHHDQRRSTNHSETTAQKRYGRWPYYVPPDGWIRNSHISSAHWTNLSPTDDWTAFHQGLFSIQTARPGSEMVNSLIHNDPISSTADNPLPIFETLSLRTSPVGPGQAHNPSSGPSNSRAGPTHLPNPSPFFATIPSAGRADSSFLLYRYAQYATVSDVENPLVHPAFECYEEMTGPDLIWDLTAPLHFPSIALSNIVPLFPEEYDTYLTHPPLRQIEIRCDVFPILALDISATSGFGITLRDFMEKLTYQLNRRLTVGEWNMDLTVDQRHQILIGYKRRTGAGVETAATRDIRGYPPSHETSYIVSDVLADEPMFLGLAMEDGDPQVWTIYTCKREQ